MNLWNHTECILNFSVHPVSGRGFLIGLFFFAILIIVGFIILLYPERICVKNVSWKCLNIISLVSINLLYYKTASLRTIGVVWCISEWCLQYCGWWLYCVVRTCKRYTLMKGETIPTRPTLLERRFLCRILFTEDNVLLS